jgi:hypothetical protein
VTVTVNPGGQAVTLLDNGLGADQAAGDGVYSGQWIPSSSGIFTLTFPGSDVVIADVSRVFFNPATNFAAGTFPRSVATGDFNGHGKLDLAVANNFSNDVSILLGTGTGSFGGAINFSVGNHPIAVATGDFNGDGKPDLAVANLLSNSVSILLGTGTGSFGPATNFAVGTDPRSVAIGDLNGDGNLDLAVANLVSSALANPVASVSILLGTGTGSFGSPTNFAVGREPYNESVAIGDFNGDGKLDLAVANASSISVSILLGTGTGSFGPATNFGVGTNPFSVAIGDFNGDGKPDLAVANLDSRNVSILLGTGTGSFGGATNFNVGSLPVSVATGDFNGDGKPDLAVANFDSQNISILLNATTALPVVTIAASDSTATESGPTTGTFRVSRTGGTGSALTVFYTLGGTAVSGTDYTLSPAPSSVTIPAGASSKTITVTPINDVVMEGNETVVMTLSPRSNYTVGSPSSATVTVVSNE